MTLPHGPVRRILGGLTGREGAVVGEVLRQETVGGTLLLAAAVFGVVLANSPADDWYAELRGTSPVPWSVLGLDLSLEQWAADGLLAVFFFVAGLELKRELVVGSLSRAANAVLPIAAALAGMLMPALVYLAVSWSVPSARGGWGVPMATDIAFALAVLAVVGSHLPAQLRAFLLTLAVVDDMGAIVIIAVVYTDQVLLLAVLGAVVALVGWWFVLRRRVSSPWLLIPLALLAWYALYRSGVHPTVAGVLLGLTTPARTLPGEQRSLAERMEHRVRPWSAGLAVPVFAFLSAGVPLTVDSLGRLWTDAAAVGVIGGLLVGKFVGVFGGTYLIARFTRAELDARLAWSDVAGVAMLSGIGFTVSLLITELAFADDLTRLDAVKTAVLLASATSAAVAAVVLRLRDRAYRDHADVERAT